MWIHHQFKYKFGRGGKNKQYFYKSGKSFRTVIAVADFSDTAVLSDLLTVVLSSHSKS